MIDKKALKETISKPLEEAGFKNLGQSWYLDGNDTIVVVNLQKSNWDDSHYINIGIWIKEFGEVAYPKFNQCPLYIRAEEFFPLQRELMMTACSLKTADNESLRNLSKFLVTEFTPFLKELGNINKIKILMKDGILNKGFIRLDARFYLDD